jgi:hypothetical protein
MDRVMTAAMIVNAPLAGTVTWNPVEMTLRRGESASLQIASMIEGRQVNWIVQALFDPRIIAVNENPFGILITALAVGECILQTLTNDGIRDIAIIRVTD